MSQPYQTPSLKVSFKAFPILVKVSNKGPILHGELPTSIR
jgi:hypothetical protein